MTFRLVGTVAFDFGVPHTRLDYEPLHLVLERLAVVILWLCSGVAIAGKYDIHRSHPPSTNTT